MKREHNERAWAVWHTAYLSTYAPEDGRKFTPLSKLRIPDKKTDPKPSDWRDTFASFSAWASAAKGKTST